MKAIVVSTLLLLAANCVLLELTSRTGRKCYLAELSPDKVHVH